MIVQGSVENFLIVMVGPLTVTGFIGNANLIDETTADDIYDGHDFVNGFCESSGLPLEFITISRELLPVVDSRQFACPVLPIERQLVPPWQKPVPLGKMGTSQ